MEIMQRNARGVSTKVDLTAMVDLGFLLITFFMLASTMAKPATMQVLMPSAEGDPIRYPQSKTATLLIGTRDKVYTYSMPDVMRSPSDFKVDSADYSAAGIRKYIQRRQAEVQAKWGNRDMLFVLIKPLPGANYKHVVDVLDEMMINQVKRYSIVEANTPVDSMVVSLTRETWKAKGNK